MSIIEKIEIAEERKQRRGSPLAYAAEEFDLREMLRKVWRQRRTLLGTIILLTGLSAVIAFQLTPVYQGEALVMVAPPKSKVVNIDAVMSGLPFGSDTLNSEIAIIRSRRLASRLVKKLKLEADPEFNNALRPQTGLLAWVGGLFNTEASTRRKADAAETHVKVVTAFRKALSVQPLYRSRVISVKVASRDPKKAALLANTIAGLYLVDQLDAKFEATRRATVWLNERLAELRKAVEITEKAVETYRREAGLVKGKDDVSIATAQISELSTQLVVARTKRAEAEARLAQIEKLMKSGRGANSAAEVLSSLLIQRLRERESQVIGRMAELSAEYGPKHPKLIAVRAEIRDLRRKIRGEVRKIIQGMRSEVQIARAREGSLNASLKKLEQRVAQLNTKGVRLRALEREAKANRALLETFLTRFKETSAQKGFQNPDARIISSAVIPAKPFSPNIRNIVVLTFLGSCIIGIMLAFALERLDAGFRSMEQIERMTGLSALGLVPELEGRSARKVSPEQYVLDKPVSAYAEAMRSLQVSIALSDVDKPPRIVLLTSASPEEGKSAISLALARVAARSGKSVAVIDCDLRRPTLHSRLKLAEAPGLVEVLAGKATRAEATQRDEPSGADVIVAGGPVPNPADLLGSDHMKNLLDEMARTYDLVVIDCSPVLAVSDARVLTRLADKTLVVVRWVKTRRDAAGLAIRQIEEAGGSVAGLVLSRVDIKRHAAYGYADSGYYHGKYAKYYTG